MFHHIVSVSKRSAFLLIAALAADVTIVLCGRLPRTQYKNQSRRPRSYSHSACSKWELVTRLTQVAHKSIKHGAFYKGSEGFAHGPGGNGDG